VSNANSDESYFKRVVKQVDAALKPIEVGHPEIQAVIFVTVVEDPLDDWADIWVDLRDGRRYAFTVYTPSMIARDMEEEDLASHVDYDQLIVREVTVPCIVDGVSKMLQMGCIDCMGALQVKSTPRRSRRKRPEIRAVKWQRKPPSHSGTEIVAELTDGHRYRFTAFSISSIAEKLRKPRHLSFVEDGLLVVRELNEDCIRKGLEEMLEWEGIQRHGVRLHRSE